MLNHSPHSLLQLPKYREDIDGLRAIAVLSVVVYHAFPESLHGGFVGVDIFFVISGFLISRIIFENLEKNTFSFLEFYDRRIRRIFPALILVLASSFAFGWVALLADEYQQFGKHMAASVGFIQNFILWNEAGYFDSSAETKPLLHLWSLAVEEQFYIFFPFLLWAAWKNKFNLLPVTIVVGAISFYLNLAGVQKDAVATFYSPQTQFWELLAGSVLGWLLQYKRDRFGIIFSIFNQWLNAIFYRNGFSNPNILANSVSLLGLSLIIWSVIRIKATWSWPGAWAVLPVLGTVLIISAGHRAWINRYILSNRVAVWVGLISYPLYLWHWPLLSFARIIEGKIPHFDVRLTMVGASITLATLTYLLIERPIRFWKHRNLLNTKILLVFMSGLGASGIVVYRSDFSETHRNENLIFKRKGFEHAIGFSQKWYRGKEDWLFLGNDYDETVAKLKLASVPNDHEVQATFETFSNISKNSEQFHTAVALIIGPNKESVYPEFLPDEVKPSSKKYSSFFLDKLKSIPNLTIYNPTDDLLRLKETPGILYYKTDTHWNSKGAFLTYDGFSRLFNLPVPQVDFQVGSTYNGDLIAIAGLNNFPLHAGDNWEVVWKTKPVWTENVISNQQNPAFGPTKIVSNPNALSEKHVWVVGDSFTGALMPYFNASFREVHYLGHWADKLKNLPSYLVKADKKPDMIIIVRVERSF